MYVKHQFDLQKGEGSETGKLEKAKMVNALNLTLIMRKKKKYYRKHEMMDEYPGLS